MSDQTRQQLNQAFEYIKAGNKAQARALLKPILDIDQNNYNAWWLMAMAVETPQEMQAALQNVVRIKPDHANARDMLAKVNAQLGTAAPAPASSSSEDPFSLPPNLAVESPRATPAARQPEPSLDDLFGEPASASRASTTPEPDDFFAPLPSSGGRPAYTPPPPTGQQKKSNPLLYILIGLVVATACICGGCLLLGGGSLLTVVNNPTFQAAIGTGITLVQAPDRLPSGMTSQGTLGPNNTQTKQLPPFTQHSWRYQGQGSETITVRVEALDQTGSNRTTGLYPYIGIYDSNGSLLERSEPTGTDRIQTLTYILPSNGTYTILVGGFGGTFGRYEIEVQSSSRQ
jgi:hypothetical protein